MDGSGLRCTRSALLSAGTALALFGLRRTALAQDHETRTGGDLQAALTQDSGCKDPWQTTLRTQLEYQRQIVDSLVYLGRDGTYSPWLAESWTVNDDATAFTFRLREGVSFTDGTTLDATAVKANFDAMKALGPVVPAPASYLIDYAGTDIVDARTVTVRFGKSNAPFLYGVSTPNLGIYSARTATLDAASRCAGRGVTSGPFTIGGYTANERIRLIRNANYRWGPAALPNTGAAHVEAVTYNIVTNPTAVADGLINGRLQWAQGITDQSLDQVAAAGMRHMEQAPAGTAWCLIVNPRRGNIGDIAVRQAMNIAIDRATLMLTQPPSISSAARGIFAPTHPFFADQSAAIAYDPARARSILDQAGWRVGSGGIRVKEGRRLRVNAISYQTAVSFSSMMELMKQQLAEVGIELTLSPITPNEERQRRTEGNFETRMSKFTGADPVILAQLVAGIDPVIDWLLAEQNRTTDPVRRRRAVSELSDYIMQQGYLIPVYDQNTSVWWRPDLSNVTFDLGDLSMMTQVQLPK